MKDFKEILFCMSFIVLLVVVLLSPAYSFAGEEIGKVIAVKGSVKIFNAQSKFLMDLKSNDEIYPGDIIVTGSKAGAQIAVLYHTSVSVSSNSIVGLNRKISRKKKESYHIILLRGRSRITSYKKLLVKKGESKNVQKLNIETPYGIFSFNGGDLVVDVDDVNAGAKVENPISVPCPSQVKVSAIGKLAGVLIDGGFPKKSSVAMEQCPEGSKDEEVVFVGFQTPKIKKKMKSKSGAEFVKAWVLAGEVGYAPPSKKRPALTIKSGEKVTFDSEGKVVENKTR